VLVDLAVERGGNVEGAKPGEVVQQDGVTIVGYLNVPGRIAASASALYAKNLLAFVETLIDKEKKTLNINWDDELVQATALTRDGAIVHPNFGGPAAAPKAEKPEAKADAPAAEKKPAAKTKKGA
jgi:NAD(P) transhydrogenase subunit alpha